ncbi:MAG: hypothetical protein ACJAYZ_000597 [Bacteroidia bacterium]|jgi:hypothetical protein
MNKFQPAFKKGAMMAAVGIIIFLILYAIDPMYFARPIGWFTLLAVNFLALPIVFMILGARDTKANFTPYTFGHAFLAALLTGVAAAVLGLVFNAIFTTAIDPVWESQIADEVMVQTELFMEKMGAPEEAIDEAMEQAKIKNESQPKGIVGQLIGTAWFILWYAILALIIGLIQRDRKPREDQIA